MSRRRFEDNPYKGQESRASFLVDGQEVTIDTGIPAGEAEQLEVILSVLAQSRQGVDVDDYADMLKVDTPTTSVEGGEQSPRDSRPSAPSEGVSVGEPMLTQADIESLNIAINAEDALQRAPETADLLAVPRGVVTDRILERAIGRGVNVKYNAPKDDLVESKERSKAKPRRSVAAMKMAGIGMLAVSGAAIAVSGVNAMRGVENQDLSAGFDAADIDSSVDRLRLDTTVEIGWPYENEDGEMSILRLKVADESGERPPQMTVSGGVALIVNRLDAADSSVTIVDGKLFGPDRVAEVDLSKLQVELKVYPESDTVLIDRVNFEAIEADGLTAETTALLAEKQDDPKVEEDTQRELLMFVERELYRNSEYRATVVDSLKSGIVDSLSAQAKARGLQLDNIEFSGEPVFVELEPDPQFLEDMNLEEAVIETIQSRSPDVNLVHESLLVTNLQAVKPDKSNTVDISEVRE